MPGDTQYDIWTDWPMHLWRNDAELAGAPRTAEIANASGMFLKIIMLHFLRISGVWWPLRLDPPFPWTLPPAPHIPPGTLEGVAALVPVPIAR